MMKDLGKKKFAEVSRHTQILMCRFIHEYIQASKLTKEINEADAKIIATMMLRGTADKKYEAAERLQTEIHQTNADMIGSIMSKELGKNKFKEAESGPCISTFLPL